VNTIAVSECNSAQLHAVLEKALKHIEAYGARMPVREDSTALC
jgi:hypothetical protein